MLTVLMAVWQGADYLGEQLDSIISQSQPVDRIVISDDGSTDKTLDIVADYQSKYPGLIELIHHGDVSRTARVSRTKGAAANFFFLIERERQRLEGEAIGVASGDRANEWVSSGKEADGTGKEAEGTGKEPDGTGKEAGSSGNEAESVGKEAVSTGIEAASTGKETASTGKAASTGKEAASAGKAASTGKEAASSDNAAARSSVADYWFLSDQDDVWLSDKVEKMCIRMASEETLVGNGHAILLYSDVKVVDKHKKVLAESLFQYQRMDPGRTSFPEVLVENPVTGGAAMFNAALLGKLSGAPKTCVMHDWWLALLAACFGEIVCLQESLSLYRQHGKNTMGASRPGSFHDLKARTSRKREVGENYRRMFAQAEGFLLEYGSRMSKKDRLALQGFLSLIHRSPLRRFGVIRKYGLYKSSLVQTLAQCFTIK